MEVIEATQERGNSTFQEFQINSTNEFQQEFIRKSQYCSCNSILKEF